MGPGEEARLLSILLCTSMAVAAQMFHKHVCSKLNAHLLQHVVNGPRFSMFSLEVTRRREEKTVCTWSRAAGRNGWRGGWQRPGLGEAPDSMVACASKAGSHLVVRAEEAIQPGARGPSFAACLSWGRVSVFNKI